MTDFCLRMLGGFQLATTNGETVPIRQRKGAALIAYLGATIGSFSARDRLAALLWGQSEQRLARQSLRQALQALGQGMAGGGSRILRLDRQMVGLDADHVCVDTARFESLIAQGDPGSLTQAGELYQGEFLAGLSVDSPDFEEWLVQSRGKYRDLALHVLLKLVEQQDAAGDYELATKTANRALRIDPFREDLHRRLMRMYAARGMRAASLSQYRECEAVLQRELGISPDEETSRLHDSIRAQGAVTPPVLLERNQSGSPAALLFSNADSLLVGRDREQQFLRRCIEVSADSGARMVLVTGESGAGKSALLEGIRPDVHRLGMIMATARARPAERKMNFAFWADLLNDPALEVVGDQEMSSSLVRRLAFLRGAQVNWNRPDATSEPDHRHVFDALVEFIRARSRTATLVLAVEDLHHADAASLRLLSYVLRNLGQSPVLVLSTLCPEELADRRDLAEVLNDLDRDRLLHRMPLRPLDRSEVETLVGALREEWGLATAPRSRLREIWTLSDGNPGIVVELVRGGFGVGSVNASLSLPKILTAELGRKLDGLDESTKLIATAASVIGEGMEHVLLARVTGLDEALTLRGVETLIAAGLLALDNNELVFTRGRLRLSQYRSMLPARRRHLHLATAEALAKTVIDDPVAHYAALVHHYAAAGHAADAMCNEVCLGQTHSRRREYGHAKRTFRRVLRAVPGTSADTLIQQCGIEARLGLAVIEEATGQAGAALTVLRGLTAEGREMPDPHLNTQLLGILGRLHIALGNDEVGHNTIRRAAHSAKGEEQSLWQPPDRILETIHYFGGRFCSGLEHLANAREQAHRHGFVTDSIQISAMLGLLHAARGSPGSALAESRAAIDAASQLGDDRHLALGLQVQGIVRTWCGNPSQALADFDTAFDLANNRGDLLRLYQIRCHRGHALIRAGRFSEALAELDFALAMAARMDITFALPLCRAWKAGALLEAGDPVAAEAEARIALQMAAAANRPWAHSVAHRALAAARAAPGIADFAGAERAIRQALEEQYAIGLEFERATSLVIYARLLQVVGDMQRSKSLVSQAQALFKQLKMVLSRDILRDLTEIRCNPCGVSR
jgi:DNA-binding SARP family transcriptional activator